MATSKEGRLMTEQHTIKTTDDQQPLPMLLGESYFIQEYYAADAAYIQKIEAALLDRAETRRLYEQGERGLLLRLKHQRFEREQKESGFNLILRGTLVPIQQHEGFIDQSGEFIKYRPLVIVQQLDDYERTPAYTIHKLAAQLCTEMFMVENPLMLGLDQIKQWQDKGARIFNLANVLLSERAR
jgi:hypothetical protein